MAFLRSSFFEKNLTIGAQSKYLLEADDGEKEISFVLPPAARCRFSYRLWRSLRGGKNEQPGGFELSQFVMLQQTDGQLRCKVGVGNWDIGTDISSPLTFHGSAKTQ